MATEIEIKLAVPSPAMMEQILADPQLTQYMLDPLTTRRMRTTYYDTPDGALQARRWTLRLRDEGGTHVAAMKTPNASSGTGMYTRREWQCRATKIDEALERLVEQGAPAELLRLTNGVALEPICEAEFDRRSACLYLPDGVRIELDADVGTLRGGANTCPLCEVELELVSGEAAPMLAFAAYLQEHHALREERKSKFVRASELVD